MSLRDVLVSRNVEGVIEEIEKMLKALEDAVMELAGKSQPAPTPPVEGEHTNG